MSENENEVLETEVVENEAGEVMFDPLAEISDEEALAALESLASDEEVAPEVTVEEVMEAVDILDAAPVPPEAVGSVGANAHKTSRQIRKDRQRGR